MKGIRLLPIVFLVSDACIDRYELPEQLASPHLVVDGMITNLPGPYTVELFVSSDLNTLLNNRVPVTKATVRIADDLGNEETLTEVQTGVYQTSPDGIRGSVGRKYHTVIFIEDREYRSEPQEMFPAGEIKDIEYAFRENVINQNKPGEPQDVLDVQIDSKGDEGEPNLFRWRWSSTYQVKTFPELRTREFGRPPVVLPDPLACSGYVPGPYGTITKVGVCTCCTCWVPEYSSRATVSQNKNVSNGAFNGVFVARVPVDHWRFSVRYHMLIEQFSLSEEAYRFWKLIQSQQEGEGSLFQPNAVMVKGNIHNRADADETVLGFFGVSAVSQKQFFIDRREVPSQIEIKNDTVKGSCLGQFRGSSNQKPIFW